MKKLLALLLPIVALLFISVAWADGQATPDDAKAMAIKAADYLKAVGPRRLSRNSVPKTAFGTTVIFT